MPGMKTMMYIMPVMFMLILNNFSAGLTYYYFLANLITLYNPQVLIVGGGIAQAGDLLLEPARRVARARARMVPADTVQIVAAQLGDDAGIIGASVLVMLHLEGRPPGRRAAQ